MPKSSKIFSQKVKKIYKSLKKILIVKIILYLLLAALVLILLYPKKFSQFVRRGLPEVEQKELPETGTERDIYKVSSTIPDPGDDTYTISIDGDDPVYALSISADISLPEIDSLVRIILKDVDNNEYLVYETYPLLDGINSFSVEKKCEETCLLDGLKLKNLRVFTKNNASINVTNIHKTLEIQAGVTQEEKDNIRNQILDEKIIKLNEEIAKNNLAWEAGRTSFSELSYAEKRKIFNNELPNFQGFDFYKAGVFEILTEDTPSDQEQNLTYAARTFFESAFTSTINYFFPNTNLGNIISSTKKGSVKSVATGSIYVDDWDWRSKHGANDPTSPYFDGNPDSQETGNGWITSIKNQASCGSCWAFAATGATEALVNLYYNQHIDLNLAEQDALSCSGAGSCGGGWPGLTLDYYTNTGVVSESCFPYTATNQSCSNKCSNPSEKIKISGKVTFSNKTEDNLKSLIIHYGPISGGIYSWSHAMTLVGWYKDGVGDTVWIFKNSWGKGWGNGGYANVKTAITNIGWTHALINPIIDQNPRTISCLDADGDGYYNWGISTDKPASCPGGIPNIKDCDDSDASLVMYDEKFECVTPPSDINASPSSHNFQRIPVGQTSSIQTITIGNVGIEALDVTNISINDTSNFTLNLSPSSDPCVQTSLTLDPSATCNIEVLFTPQTEATYNTNVVVSSTDDSLPVMNIPVSGQGTYDPQTVCNYFSGIWISGSKACVELSDQECLDYRGSLNLCDSICTPYYFSGCTQTCVKSCEF